MKHNQILDKLASKRINQAIDEDLARLVRIAMSFKKGGSINDISAYVLPKILTRWNCVFLAKKELSKFYKEKTFLSLAILLHKYGISDKGITQNAIDAIDKLNGEVVLSDDFYRKSSKIKDFLNTEPKELKRKPTQPKNVTFFRPKDIVSININSKYYLAYIHKLTGVNESPILEFYENIYDEKPTLESIKSFKAKGEKYNDGIVRKSFFAVYGMTYEPDMANQIHLIKSCKDSEILPQNEHLEEPIGLFTVSNLFFLQKTIKNMFNQ